MIALTLRFLTAGDRPRQSVGILGLGGSKTFIPSPESDPFLQPVAIPAVP
jgi:hypothetical protein